MKHTLHLLTLAALCLTAPASRAQTLTATVSSDRVTTMSNGLVTLTIGSNGRVSALTPQGGSNVIGSSGIYFDYTADKNYALSPTKAEVVRKDDDMVEVVYSNLANNPQLSQGFILRRGVSGVYVYVTVGGTQASASVSMREIRVCTRLASTFLNGYVDDTMQGRIPSNSEMKTAEQSENVVADATYRLADGSIYTKYDWTQYIVRDSVHGLMNDNTGVWNIACSHEWANGGPMKQELTVHATSKSPITIQMLQGEHMGASAQTFGNGDEKLYGPFLIYVNRGTPDQMIADAKATAHRQQQEWPFAWFRHKLWPQQRTTVEGTLSVATGQRSDSIQVVLAEPGSDVYTQGKRYIYWALTDSLGHFSIPAVRPADYTLYAYATSGDVTDELSVDGIHADGDTLSLGTIEWTPRCYQNLLWTIGSNNRLADGFALSDAPRAYLLPEQVPASLTYTVGESNPATDWYYAQTKKGTWTIRFSCPQSYTGTARLTASLAAVTSKPTIKVSLNGTALTTWSWSTNDAAIYRSANQSGRHDLKTLGFSAALLRKGTNTLTLELTNGTGRNGVMWDCIKLETGPLVTNAVAHPTEPEALPASTLYYNPQGIPLAHPAPGLNIVHERLADGTQRTRKIMLRP